jgi:hypothetical protein
MNIASMAFQDPAAVQAWSAVAIAVLTLVLAGATIAYAVLTARLARQAAESAQRAALMAAPVLVFTVHPWLSSDTDVEMEVRNSGSGVATDLVLFSDWPDPISFGAAIGWHDAPIRLGLVNTSLPAGFTTAPTPTAWEFSDLSGTDTDSPSAAARSQSREAREWV